jgi:hypothetical protein
MCPYIYDANLRPAAIPSGRASPLLFAYRGRGLIYIALYIQYTGLLGIQTSSWSSSALSVVEGPVTAELAK